QRSEWTVELDVERRLDRDVLQTGQNPRPFLKRKSFGIDVQRQANRRRSPIEATVENEMAPRCLDEEVIEEPAVSVVADAAGQPADAKIGIGAGERGVRKNGVPRYRLIV